MQIIFICLIFISHLVVSFYLGTLFSIVLLNFILHRSKHFFVIKNAKLMHQFPIIAENLIITKLILVHCTMCFCQ